MRALVDLVGRGQASLRYRSHRRWRRTARAARRASWRVADVSANAFTATSLSRAGSASSPAPPAVLLSVYRRANAALIGELVTTALDAGWRVALWALDEPVPELASLTAGVGLGSRTELLNRLYAAAAPSAEQFVVVADDDALLVKGGLVELVALADRGGLGLAQPAHDPSSFFSHHITVALPWSVARHTSFVEIGPLLVISPLWRSRVLPFPAGYGMGWGLDLLWPELEREGCRLGIIDAVRVRHLDPPASAYDASEERDRVERMLRERHVTSMGQAGRSMPTWRPWQHRPPWI